jgi:hypothetical protein
VDDDGYDGDDDDDTDFDGNDKGNNNGDDDEPELTPESRDDEPFPLDFEDMKLFE